MDDPKQARASVTIATGIFWASRLLFQPVRMEILR
jgi:hypothetical protein